MEKTNYLASFGRAPFLPIKDADSAYVIFTELLDQPIPPKNVPIIMRSGSKMKSLGYESGITDGWKRVSSGPFSSYRVEIRLQDDCLSPQLFEPGWNSFEQMGASHGVNKLRN